MRQSVERLRSLLLIFCWTLQLRTERISFRETKMRDRRPFIRMLSILFYTFAALALFSGFWSVIQGYQWMKMVRRHAVRHPGFYAPRVALICPCKGLEPGLESNLRALVSQDYGSYEVFFVLARSEDSASSLVRKIAQSSAVPAHVVIAGAAHNCGEKVNNLRVAVEQVPADFEIFAFADSDGRPGRQWLARLVAPLSDARLGAATTYRWTLPDRGGFWSALGAAWDASIVTMLGDHAHNFCWGGGTAIRRSVFETTNIIEYWKGALSDDWAITRALQSAGRQIVFVPESLTPTPRDMTLRSLIEFTNRQITITRVYSPSTWTVGAISHVVYCAALLLGALSIADAITSGEQWLQVSLLMCVLMLLAAAKGVLRWVAVNELLPTWKPQLVKYAWAWTLLAPVAPFVFAINFAVSAFRRRITWRGVSYELISPVQTRIV
jgi:ceramide glucosyltransferase